MVKFTATIKYCAESDSGRWSIETKADKGGAVPENDRDISMLLRAIADQIDRDALKKLN